MTLSQFASGWLVELDHLLLTLSERHFNRSGEVCQESLGEDKSPENLWKLNWRKPKKHCENQALMKGRAITNEIVTDLH